MMIKEPSRSNVLGVGVSALNMPLAIDYLFQGADQPGQSGFVTVTGVHGVVESQSDDELKKIHNRSYLTTPDGMPMVWIGWLNGYNDMDRVYGPDLMLEILARSQDSGHKHYLFGGSDGVVDLLAESLVRKFPQVNMVGKTTPPFRPLTDEEEQLLVVELTEKKPHFLWVGLSTPKQERFMHDLLAKYPDLTKDWDHGLIMLGVGAAFDFHAGLVKQAPYWMQRSGLEWLFRTCMEPKRLWKRYAVSNTKFLTLFFLHVTGLKKYPLIK